MRIALIADIHGNLVALEAVLADIEAAAVDQIVCLGDVAASGPQPGQVVAKLRALGCPVVLGNTDAALAGLQAEEAGEGEDARRIEEIDHWCAAQLMPADLAYLRAFQPTVEVMLEEDVRLLCFHGSPRDNEEEIGATTSNDGLKAILAGHTGLVLAGAHTHTQLLRRVGGSLLINPGSVGLPFETTSEGTRNPPWAEYAIVTWRAGSLSVDLRRVPVDLEAVTRAARASGMPHAEWWARDWR